MTSTFGMMENDAFQAAENLGIPAVYDVRYRINAAVITDPKRVARAARHIDRMSSGQQQDGSASGAQVSL